MNAPKVFINCPFDADYKTTLHALLFCLVSFGCKPLVATLRQDGGENRFEKIVGFLKEADFSIHDLSRCISTGENEVFRMNMPFELGLDLGMQQQEGSRSRKILILEGEKYSLKPALSDIGGMDPVAHGNDYKRLIREVQKFFQQELKRKLDGPSRIAADFEDCHGWIIEKKISRYRYSEEEAKDLTDSDWIDEAEAWIVAGKPAMYSFKMDLLSTRRSP